MRTYAVVTVVGTVALIAAILVFRGGARTTASWLVPAAACITWAALRARGHLARGLSEWESFEIAMSPDAIRLSKRDRPVEFRRDEVTALREFDRGLVLSAGGLRAIWIPRALDGYEFLRAALSNWRDVERPASTSRATDALGATLAAAFIFAMAALELRVLRTPATEALWEIVALEGLGAMTLGFALRASFLDRSTRRTFLALAVVLMSIPLVVALLRSAYAQ